jgi:hypothetical protein
VIIPVKKNMSQAILSRLNKDGSEESMEVKPEERIEGPSPYRAMAEDLMQAVQDKSVDGIEQVFSALAAHIGVGEEE